MRKNMIPATILVISFALASCGGGGGGNLATSLNSPQLTPPSMNNTAPTDPQYYVTGATGSVSVPLPASFGTSPVPAQLATTDGSGFDTTNNTAFPVLATSLQAKSTGLAAPTSNESATIVLTSAGTGSYIDPCDGFTYTGTGAKIQLSIPSVNVSVSFSTPDIHNADVSVTTGLSYVQLGVWDQPTSQQPNLLQSATAFVFGFETPTAAMPASGQASFQGEDQGKVFVPINGAIAEAQLGGSATLSVDFSSGKISGALTKQTASSGNSSVLPWNDVSLAASIAAGTNKFSGTTVVTSAPGNAFSLKSSAMGSVNGGFYGPTAQEVGAIWTLSDATASAIGGVVASSGH